MLITKALRFSVAIFLPVLSYSQTQNGGQWPERITEIHGPAPAETAHIIESYVDKAPSDSGYETGSLHIKYSDKTEVVETLRPKQKSPEKEIVENQEGITDLKVAEDQRTIGWAETFDNCCTSYSIPMGLAIYRSGKTVLHIQQGQMLWYWMFDKGGKQAIAVWGTTHGPEVGDYQLYDTQTGKMLGEVSGDEEIQGLKSNAPEWAKGAEQAMHHQSKAN
jgi:hypothetical protein